MRSRGSVFKGLRIDYFPHDAAELAPLGLSVQPRIAWAGSLIGIGDRQVEYAGLKRGLVFMRLHRVHLKPFNLARLTYVTRLPCRRDNLALALFNGARNGNGVCKIRLHGKSKRRDEDESAGA